VTTLPASSALNAPDVTPRKLARKATGADRIWDHAVGPMQFISSTWRTWQVDGDGDGVSDPNDVDGAAVAAARYLCQSGDLMIGDTWSRAILSYNNSADYVLDVYTAADSYADRTG